MFARPSSKVHYNGNGNLGENGSSPIATSRPDGSMGDETSSNLLLPTAGILTSSLNPSGLFEAVTFRDTITGLPDGGTVQFKDGAVSLGAPVAINLNGVATYTTSALNAGVHTITAEYSGTANYDPCTSNTIIQTVNKGSTSSILTSSLNPSQFFEAVTFRDTITGLPDGGTVQFKDGGINLGTPVSVGLNGVASLTISTLSAGTHSITAEYSGTVIFDSSISNLLTQVVNKKPTTGILTSNLNPSVFGQLVTLKDSVSGLPDGGTVQFKDGGINLGTPVLVDPNGVATITASTLSAGTHSITAEYSGTVNFDPSVSNSASQVVNKKPTTGILTSNLNPSVFGQLVMLKDSVTGLPDGGTVQFKDGGINLGPPVSVDPNGVATITASTLSAGTHSITAEYSGTVNFDPSISNLLTQVVNKKPTTGILTSSLNPSVFGQIVTLKDSVTGLPDGGTVQFKDGGINLGSPVPVDVNGVATYTVPNFNPGTHSISAEYSGTANYDLNTSNVLIQLVNKKPTTGILTSNLNPSVFGQLVTLKDSVTGFPDGGTVQFKDGGINLGTPVSVDPNGTASITVSTLAAGTHSISAEYGGTANYDLNTSNVLIQLVNKKPTTGILTSNLNPSIFGQPITFKDSVTGLPVGGTVQFKDGGINSGAPVPIDINGVATYTTANFNAGSHTITADYSGTGNFDPSLSNTIVQVVNKKATTSQLTTSLNPSVYGQVVAFKDSVSGLPDGGTVQFKDGAVNLGAPVAVDVNGVAIYSASNLTASAHSITAEYSGTVNYEPGISNTVPQLVNKRSSTSILTSSLNPSGYSQLVTFKDTVIGSLPDGGTVQFKDAGVNLGAPVTLDANGVALLSTFTLNVGTHTITAEYGGTANINPGISNSVSQLITNKTTSSILTSSLNPSVYGDAVIFKDTVSGSPDGGFVQFKDGVVNLGSPVAISTSGVATITISTLNSGTHVITAEYSGTANFGASSSNPVSQVIGIKTTLNRLTTSLNPSVYGQSVTFMDSIYNTIPDGGTVQFSDGGVNLGTPVPVNANGVATLTISTLNAGLHYISAVYSGTANFTSSNSNTVSEIINKKSTASNLVSSLNPAVYGQSIALRDTVSGIPAGIPDSGSVQFKDGGVNIGSPLPLSSGGISSVILSNLVAGTHIFTAEYSGSSNFVSSISNIITQVVNKHATASVLTSSVNPSAVGQLITLRDTITGAVPDGGTVQFKDGATNIGAAVPITSNGLAILTTSALTIGVHPISAVYGGTANFLGNTSNIVTQTVNKKSTTSILASSPNPSAYGQAVTFKDSVFNSLPDAGTVQFKDGGVNLGTPVAINKKGVAVYTATSLSIGGHSVTAEYSGTANYDPCISNSVTQTVTKKKPLSILTASASSIYSGQLLTLRDSVIGSMPDGGTVQFKDGTANLGSAITLNGNGSAYYSVSGLITGTHSFSAVYGGSVTNDSSFSNIRYVTVGDTSLYRSFTSDSISLSKDSRGEYGKLVKRKPVRVDFAFAVGSDSENITKLHIEFNIPVDSQFPFYTNPHSVKSTKDPNLKVWDFVFDSALASGSQVTVSGFGSKGRDQKIVKYFWLRGDVRIGNIYYDPPFSHNSQKLSMPNRMNVVAEEFFQHAFDQTGGLIVGKDRKSSGDSSRYYGWLQSSDYTDIVKTLSNPKYGSRHNGEPKGFDYFDNVTQFDRPVLGPQRILKPVKYNNRLLADVVALKVSIVASAMKKTPLGFGELVFDDSGDPVNPYNGLMIRDIASRADSMMMGYYSGRGHYFYSASVYRKLDSTIQKINSAFEGRLDTLSFADSLVLTGLYSLAERPFLRKNPNVIPMEIVPIGNITDEIPVLYHLNQNYPNPFNPVTTIQFELPVTSFVTLRIYNLLGQEIATLTDRQIMDEGLQEIDFDAHSLASGVYLYRIIAEQLVDEESGMRGHVFSGAKKMILLK